jgi:hypothetical protein
MTMAKGNIQYVVVGESIFRTPTVLLVVVEASTPAIKLSIRNQSVALVGVARGRTEFGEID